MLFIYLFICSSTIRQGLEQDSKAQTCTDSYPKITENPTQYKSKEVKSKLQITNCTFYRPRCTLFVLAIYTAAMETLGGGGDAIKAQLRRPEIVADAAYIILTSDSRQHTGNFYIDEEVLRRSGVSDFQKYRYAEGRFTLADLFAASICVMF